MNCLLLPTESFANHSATVHESSQINHIHKVLGAATGDLLKIGQLGGNLGTAVIKSMAVDAIHLCDIELTTAPPPKIDMTVVLALPRPKVLRRLMMDMTALGVRDIILINSQRTQKSYWQSPMLARLDEFVLEGLQQSVDTVAPRVRIEKRFKPFVEDTLASLITHDAIVAHPYSECSLAHYLPEPSHRTPSLVCIGAEGGWIDYEIQLLTAQGCTAVSLGPRILRTEAAVNAILGRWLPSGH